MTDDVSNDSDAPATFRLEVSTYTKMDSVLALVQP